MTFPSLTRPLVTAALLAALPLASVTPSIAAGDPAVACASAYAKIVSKCIKKAAGVHAKCYQDTGAKCADDDANLLKAIEKTKKTTFAKCVTDTAIIDAGYGPVGTNGRLAFQTVPGYACKAQARVLAERAFGRDGARYTGADPDGKKCLLTAAKESAKFVSKQVGALSKCVETGCTFDFSAAAADLVSTLDTKCPSFASVTGTTSTAFVAQATGQIARSVESSCDPMDTTRCMFPYPNNLFTVGGADTPTGRRIALGPLTAPKTAGGAALVPDPWNEADGFSIGPMILIGDPNIDLAQSGAAPITDIAESLDPTTSVMLLDAETGEQQLMWMERDQRGSTIADQPLIGRVAKNLKNSHRYIVVMRNMKNSMGAAVPAPAGFAVYRDNTPTLILPVEARRAEMEALIDEVVAFGVTRSELYLAWDFTTQSEESTNKRLLAMRDDAFTILGSAAPSFTVDTVTAPLDSHIAKKIVGTFQVPNYLNSPGTPPSTLRTNSYGVPQNTGDFFTANYECIIPNTATSGTPARISLYGHGLLGDFDEVDAGNVRDMAYEHNMVFCATDWVGFASGDSGYVLQVVQNFTRFPAFIDRQHQGMLNMMFLGRLLKHASGFASNVEFQSAGLPIIDTSDLFYDGNSQGGILGGVLAAYEQDLTRLSLGVPGINYSLLLNRSVDFNAFDVFLIANYPKSTDRNALLSLAQLLWDRTDPNGHVNHVTSNPYAGTPAKTLLYQVAFGDHQVAPVSAEIAARSVGASIHSPILQMSKVVPEVTPYYGIPTIPSYPFSGSALVIWDSGNPAPPTGNVPPATITNADSEWADLGPCPQSHNSDPHSCPRSNANARAMKSAFLQTGGSVIDTCTGAACLAP